MNWRRETPDCTSEGNDVDGFRGRCFGEGSFECTGTGYDFGHSRRPYALVTELRRVCGSAQTCAIRAYYEGTSGLVNGEVLCLASHEMLCDELPTGHARCDESRRCAVCDDANICIGASKKVCYSGDGSEGWMCDETDECVAPRACRNPFGTETPGQTCYSLTSGS